jgi:hypothetical protein
MVAPEPSRDERRDPEPWDTWRRVVSGPDLEHVYRGAQSTGYR